MAVKLGKLKAKLKAKKLKEGSPSKTKKAKVKAADVSADDELLWDEDHPNSVGPTKVTKREVTSLAAEARQLVRSVGAKEDEDDDDGFEEANAAFEKHMRNVAKRISDKHQPYNSPATQEIVTREALAAVIRLLPGYESTANTSKAERAAYAFSNQVNLARELMNDLRAMSSTDALADRVVQEAVAPLYMALVNFLINEISTIRTKVNSGNTLDGLKRTLNDSLTNLLTSVGSYGQESLDAASEKARSSLRN
jgi:hypothetical protein